MPFDQPQELRSAHEVQDRVCQPAGGSPHDQPVNESEKSGEVLELEQRGVAHDCPKDPAERAQPVLDDHVGRRLALL